MYIVIMLSEKEEDLFQKFMIEKFFVIMKL